MKDILTEEVMLELHIMHGFDQLDLVQWLRGIDFGGLRFFEMQAREKNILYLDQLMTRSQMNIVVIEGVRVDSVLGYFESLDRLVEYAIRKRISFKQFRQLLFTLAPTDDALIPVVDRLIKDHHVLKKITGSQQILPFRVFCALFDYLSNKQTYLTGIGQVFDQLLTSSTPVKTCQLLNQMPYPIIQYIVERFIQQNQLKIMDHLNDRLPLFDYGMIRKIVRRHSLGLNYKYD